MNHDLSEGKRPDSNAMAQMKQSFIDAEQDTEGKEQAASEPIRERVVLYVTGILFLSGVVSVCASVYGLTSVREGLIFVLLGGSGGVLGLALAAVVLHSRRRLSKTSLLQGYMVLGVLGVASAISEVALVTLLCKVAENGGPYTHIGAWRWAQFLGGVQSALAAIMGILVCLAVLASQCCSKTPRDNVVGVYQPR
ncbi:uncharacterized protein LOC143019212 [Oratosquilla oratoria]|uniref:uncharacterized protein LOC143019212 n=1 Tax=Oratosquilla oratoria TaxID=337810 RepID=UPI003F75AE45